MYKIIENNRVNCQKKIKYNSKNEADSDAAFREKKYGKKLSAYKCTCCEGWHLTTRNEKERVIIKKLIRKSFKLNQKVIEKRIRQEADYWEQKLNS